MTDRTDKVVDLLVEYGDMRVNDDSPDIDEFATEIRQIVTEENAERWRMEACAHVGEA